MSNRAGPRSPASAASRMRAASNVLLDCACCSGVNELHAKLRADCMSLTVSELKCLSSAAMNVPKEAMTFSKLARSAPPRLSDARPTEPGLLCLWKAHHSGEDGLPNDVRLTPESGHVQCNYGCPLWANSGHPWESVTLTSSQICPL
jgi:hypothetical protein